MIHGEEEAEKAQASARALFGGGAGGDVPTTEVTEEQVEGASDILSLLVLSGLCATKSEARRNIQQGGVTANDEKVTDIGLTFTQEQLRAGVLLRRGKKNYHKILLK